MSGPVLIATIAAAVVVVIVIVMCVLADRLARIPDAKVSITDTDRAIGAVLHAMVTIFTDRSRRHPGPPDARELGSAALPRPQW